MKLSLAERLRTARENPKALLSRMGIVEGMCVADLGAGHGLFSIAAAEMVGKGGRVYAVEPDPARFERIGRRVAEEGFANVSVLKTGAERMALIPDSSVDLALSLNTLHHFEDKGGALSETRRILRSGGRLYVRDMLWSRFFRHGAREAEVRSLASGVFTDVKISMSSRRVEITFTK